MDCERRLFLESFTALFDGAASNDTQNILAAAKLAPLLPRAALDNPADWLTAATMLAGSTTTAARAFAMGGGALRVESPPDLAVFDRNALPLAPAHDIATQSVFVGASPRARAFRKRLINA